LYLITVVVGSNTIAKIIFNPNPTKSV
jgi:hypothetical protein